MLNDLGRGGRSDKEEGERRKKELRGGRINERGEWKNEETWEKNEKVAWGRIADNFALVAWSSTVFIRPCFIYFARINIKTINERSCQSGSDFQLPHAVFNHSIIPVRFKVFSWAGSWSRRRSYALFWFSAKLSFCARKLQPSFMGYPCGVNYLSNLFTRKR